MIPRFVILFFGVSLPIMAQSPTAEIQSAAAAQQEAQRNAAVAAGLSPFVTSMLPTVDTNVGIGISYPTGSSDYMYLVAGIRPPGGDPRLPSTTTNVVVVPEVAVPLVTYEPAAAGAREVMTREVIGDRIIEFPPGAWIRGLTSMRTAARPTSAAPRPISMVPIEVAVRTETGEELVQNFPPGARLVRNVAPAAPPK